METIIKFYFAIIVLASCSSSRICVAQQYGDDLRGKSFQFVGFKDSQESSIDSINVDSIAIDIKFLEKKTHKIWSFIGTKEAIYNGRYREVDSVGRFVDYYVRLDEKVSAVFMTASPDKERVIFKYGEVLSKVVNYEIFGRKLFMYGRDEFDTPVILVYEQI